MKKILLLLIIVAGIGLGDWETLLEEDFEDPTFPPSGWISIDRGDSRNWTRTNDPRWHDGNGTWEAYIYSYPPCAWGLEDWLVTSAIDLTDPEYTGARVVFELYYEYYGSEWFRLYATDDQSTPWNGDMLKEWRSDQSGLRRVSLDGYLGETIYLGWGYKVWSCGGWDVGIDNVKVEAFRPTGGGAYDLAITASVEPSSKHINAGETYHPTCRVENLGAGDSPSEIVHVYCTIKDLETMEYVYDETSGLTEVLSPGDATNVEFTKGWVPEEGKDYQIVYKFEPDDVPDDTDHSNDMYDFFCTTKPADDLTPTEVVAPTGELYVGESVNPVCRVMNVGTEAQRNAEVYCSIKDAGGTEKYSGTAVIENINAGDEKSVSFEDAWVPDAAGTYTVYFIVEEDENPTNDTITGTVNVLTGIAENSIEQFNVRVYTEASSNIKTSLMLKKTSSVKIEVYDISGNRVKVIYSGRLNQGEYCFTWRGVNAYNQKVATGFYFIKVKVNETSRVYKALLF